MTSTIILIFYVYYMLIDALIIFLMQSVTFTYRDDCVDIPGYDIVAYHRVEGNKSSINFCEGWYKYELLVHELGHELYWRMRNAAKLDTKEKKLFDTWTKLYDLSKEKDFVSKYWSTSAMEDFCETFKYFYVEMWGKYTKLKDDEPSWIWKDRTKVLDAKLQYIAKVVEKYNTSIKK